MSPDKKQRLQKLRESGLLDSLEDHCQSLSRANDEMKAAADSAARTMSKSARRKTSVAPDADKPKFAIPA